MASPREFPAVRFPCPRPPAMADDQRVAYCDACRKHVHNLSAMSAAAQARLLAREPAACVRYRRPLAAALPLAAAALLWTGMGNAQESTEPAPDSETDYSMDVMIVGGVGSLPPLASVFLEEEQPAASDAGSAEGGSAP